MSYGTALCRITEEEELSTHLLHASKIGYGRDVCEAESTLGGSKITNGWSRAGESTAGVRMDAT